MEKYRNPRQLKENLYIFSVPESEKINDTKGNWELSYNVFPIIKDLIHNQCLNFYLQLLTHKRLQEAAIDPQTSQSDDCVYSVPIIIARVVNFGSQIPLKNLKANYYGLFNYHITF